METATLFLKPGREKSIKQHHPWIFSGAVARLEGAPASGETVAIRSASGENLGWAAYSPQSQISARMWTWNPAETIDRSFFCRKVGEALRRREALYPTEAERALRLCHAESDGLPGVVVDRYAGWLVFQFLTAGAEAWRDTLVDVFLELTGLQYAYERSDVEVRRLEGLVERAGPLSGEMPGRIQIVEDGLRYWVDLAGGQKTGFYIDQQPNRKRVRALCTGRSVLNCFCYTGGFTFSALAGGAKDVLSIDSSGEALEIARENLRLNAIDPERTAWQEADVFQALRRLRDQGKSFDAIILDPPKFAPTAAQAERAARGYKDINLLAFKLLNPGGLLFTFSCSGGISADFFQKIIAGAALDAGVDAAIIERLSQAPDHPTALHFPEGSYLKGLVCQIA